ncbi:MAG: hypothetical protein EXR93_00170 [Gemmatimonadetes bacterium]|nr:hypothetical protein [Gemmatimonadota bacterium]
MRQIRRIHPLLLAMSHPLFLLAQNPATVPAWDAAAAAGICLAGAAIVLVASMLVTRDSERGALAAGGLVILIFLYGPMLDAAAAIHLGDVRLGRTRYVLPAWTLISATVLFTVGKARHADRLNVVLAVASAALCATSGFRIGAHAITTRHVVPLALIPSPVARAPDAERRSVYYIILDDYGSERGLRRGYGIDNSAFTDSLRKQGFRINPDTKSNYPITLLSLSSSLNMRYIAPEASRAGGVVDPYELIRTNMVMNFFRSRGYRVVHYSSGNGPTMRSPLADVNVMCQPLGELATSLMKQTVFNILQLSFASREARVRCIFRELRRSASDTLPTFYFAHILVPHPPYLFNADCTRAPTPSPPPTIVAEWRDGRSYGAQLKCVNRLALEVVDAVRKRNPEPVIVLQGDHGPAALMAAPVLGGRAPTDDALAVRLGILNAVSLPGTPVSATSWGTTPVNTFRLIFNRYFGANLRPLRDTSFFVWYDDF